MSRPKDRQIPFERKNTVGLHHLALNVDGERGEQSLQINGPDQGGRVTITEAGLDGFPYGDFALSKYFATRAASIHSGTSEVHRNIIARALGLP